MQYQQIAFMGLISWATFSMASAENSPRDAAEHTAVVISRAYKVSGFDAALQPQTYEVTVKSLKASSDTLRLPFIRSQREHWTIERVSLYGGLESEEPHLYHFDFDSATGALVRVSSRQNSYNPGEVRIIPVSRIEEMMQKVGRQYISLMPDTIKAISFTDVLSKLRKMHTVAMSLDATLVMYDCPTCAGGVGPYWIVNLVGGFVFPQTMDKRVPTYKKNIMQFRINAVTGELLSRGNFPIPD